MVEMAHLMDLNISNVRLDKGCLCVQMHYDQTYDLLQLKVSKLLNLIVRMVKFTCTQLRIIIIWYFPLMYGFIVIEISDITQYWVITLTARQLLNPASKLQSYKILFNYPQTICQSCKINQKQHDQQLAGDQSTGKEASYILLHLSLLLTLILGFAFALNLCNWGEPDQAPHQ